MKGLYLLLFTFLVFACTNRTSETRTTGVLADSAMVVSAHPLASQIGVNIMKKGGNAVDAAIATQLALSVSFPAAGNIGGGGFMVIRLKDGTTTTL
ncbi:MAG: gamma-glutamyltransferase, partial [Cyclobacteriaceae bacterium]